MKLKAGVFSDFPLRLSALEVISCLFPRALLYSPALLCERSCSTKGAAEGFIRLSGKREYMLKVVSATFFASLFFKSKREFL